MGQSESTGGTKLPDNGLIKLNLITEVGQKIETPIKERASAEEQSAVEKEKEKREGKIPKAEELIKEDEEEERMANILEQKSEADHKDQVSKNNTSHSSKYHDLLHAYGSEGRKKSFKLKLHGSGGNDSPEEKGEQVWGSNSPRPITYQSALIPSKTEIKPHAKEILYHFHDVLGQKPFQVIIELIILLMYYSQLPARSL